MKFFDLLIASASNIFTEANNNQIVSPGKTIGGFWRQIDCKDFPELLSVICVHEEAWRKAQ